MEKSDCTALALIALINLPGLGDDKAYHLRRICKARGKLSEWAHWTFLSRNKMTLRYYELFDRYCISYSNLITKYTKRYQESYANGIQCANIPSTWETHGMIRIPSLCMGTATVSRSRNIRSGSYRTTRSRAIARIWNALAKSPIWRILLRLLHVMLQASVVVVLTPPSFEHQSRKVWRKKSHGQ